MGRFLDILERTESGIKSCDKSDRSDQRAAPADVESDFGRFGRFGRTTAALADAFAVLQRRCPDLIETKDWQQAVADGRRFLAQWGAQAAALDWSTWDLFGLHRIPGNPVPSYRRLSRYDETGLVWLLRGRPVVALTALTAAIEHRNGVVTIYRKKHKPASGPAGDSLDDLS